MKTDKCPICGEALLITLVESLTDNLHPNKYVEKITSRCDVPYTIPHPKGVSVKYHYHRAAINEEAPYYQEFVIYPYIVYKDFLPPSYEAMSFHKFDDNYILQFVMSLPSLDLPWQDPDKVRKKLKTLIVFS
jgi:hypothetical protein